MKRTKRLLSVFLALTMIFSLTVVLSAPASVDAASKRTKAVRAYKKHLKKYSDKYEKFALAYIDNNKIPELLVKKGNGCYVLTYYGGKVKTINKSSYNVFGARYYKKTGILFFNGYYCSHTLNKYFRISGGKCKTIAMESGSYRRYYYVNDESVSKSEYNAAVKEFTKGKKSTGVKFHANTESGRKKYCK